MSWNEPGRGRPDPWNPKKPASPPDLDRLLAEAWKKLKAFFHRGSESVGRGAGTGSGKGSEYFLIALGVALVIWALSGFFIVNPAEQAVVLRFGRYIETVSPGLHWIPRFIESKRTLDVQKIYSFPLQGDFLTKSSSLSDQGAPCVAAASGPGGDGCSDQSKNLVDIELNVMYRISDPRQYLYGVVSPDDTIRQLAASTLSEVAGSMQLDEVLTTGRELLASGVFSRLKASLAAYSAGLDVVAVTLRKVQAPDQVREAFNDVNRAVQDKKTAINQAEAYASKVIPLAKGAAARTLANARAYQQRVTLIAQGDVARYQALLKVYLIAPEVTKTRLYFDTLETIFRSSPKILLDLDRSAGGSNVVYLPLDRLSFAKPKVEEARS